MNIAFIINPVSGSRQVQRAKRTLPERIEQLLDHQQWSPVVVHTEYAGHATELARRYAEEGFDAVVAVGGDGTVNEVARGLASATGDAVQAAMGIIPMGSGNGLARHLGIPMDADRALQLINRAQAMPMDYGLANDRLFVSTCGTGFDAEVADRFAGSTRRGLTTYIRTILHLVFTYRPATYQLSTINYQLSTINCQLSTVNCQLSTINYQLSTPSAFLITFANANQWGNGAIIAPRADVSDGEMDVMIMSPRALLGSLPLAVRLFAGTIDRSPLMQSFRTSELTLHRPAAAPFHIDGDPQPMGTDIHIRIVHHGLRVLVARP